MLGKNIRPARIQQMGNIRVWRNALKGEPAFIVANGCSVNDESLSPIQGYFTIGINRAFLLFDPVVLFYQDVQLWETEREKVLKSAALKVCRDIADPQSRFYNFRLRTSEGFRLPDFPHLLFGGGATGPLAFQFAYSLGCNPIVLIGYDCKYRNAKTDFYGVNPNHRPTTLVNCSRGLNWIKNLHTEREIINCGDNDVFPQRSPLAEAMKKIVSPPQGRDYYINVLATLARK